MWQSRTCFSCIPLALDLLKKWQAYAPGNWQTGDWLKPEVRFYNRIKCAVGLLDQLRYSYDASRNLRHWFWTEWQYLSICWILLASGINALTVYTENHSKKWLHKTYDPMKPPVFKWIIRHLILADIK